MRPWMIALAGAVGGLAAAVAWLWLGPSTAADFDPGWTAFVREAGPFSALIFLAAYAGLVLLLTTAAVALDLVRVRFRLDGPGTPSHGEWAAAFAGTGLARLADRALDLAPADPRQAAAVAELVLQSRFDPGRLRREVLCHYRDWLVRGHFATALVLLAVIAGLGLAQDYANARVAGFLMPSRSALAAIGALAVLAVCGRLAVAAAAEPLIDTIAQLPLPRVEMRLFDALSALVHRDGEIVRAGSAAVPATTAINPMLERLALALEGGRDALREAIARLSANSAALAAAARAIAEHQTGSGQPGADPGAVAELRQAITALAVTIEHLPAATAQHGAAGEGQPPAAAAAAAAEPPRRRRTTRRSDLGSELRRLISEFE
jgi:hypothetical protein